MSTVQRIAKNAAVLLVAQVASYLLAFFYIMYTARHLGAEGFGILSFALAFTAIFGIFADLGLRPLTVREVARDKTLAPKYLANLSLMKIILAAVTFGMIALTINLMDYPQQTIEVVYLLGLSVILMAFTQMFYSIFQAFERMEFQSLGQMLNATSILIGVILAIKYDFSVVGFAALFCIAGIIVLVYSFVVLRWKFSSSPLWSSRKTQIDWSFWKPTIKQALPFGLSFIFVTVFYWIDSVMLSLMKGDEVVGWYNAAYRIVLALLFIPTAFNSAIFPIMSRFHVSSQSSLQLSYEKYFKYMLVLGIPIGVGTTLLANRIILLTFGAEYMPSVIVLEVLVWATVAIFVSSPFFRVLEATNNQLKVTKAAGICMILNVILNLLLIPRYSYTGASIATVATEVLSLGIGFWYCSKLGYSIPRKLFDTGIKVAIIGALMAIFIIYLDALSLPLLIVISALLYFMLLLAARGIDKEDWDLLRTVLRTQRERPS